MSKLKDSYFKKHILPELLSEAASEHWSGIWQVNCESLILNIYSK